jgi:hypothetical protein
MRGSTTTGARSAHSGLVCAGLGLALGLGGCGTYVPSHQEFGNDADGAIFENAIVDSIHCELRNAVIKTFMGSSKDAAFLQTWAVQVALQLTIEERTTVTPSALFSFLPGLFTLGVGANVYSDATRLDKFAYYYTVHDLLKHGPCDTDYPVKLSANTGLGSLLIRNDLKTYEWLAGLVLNKVSTEVDKMPNEFSKTQNGFSHDVKFTVDTSINATPGAKLTTVTLMPSGTFLTADRTRTHEVTFTFGPASDDDKSKKQLAATAQAIFLSNQISSGIAASLLRSTISP